MPGRTSRLLAAAALALALAGGAASWAQTPPAEPAPAEAPAPEAQDGAAQEGTAAEAAEAGEAPPPSAMAASWDTFADSADRLIHDAGTTTPALEHLRERLVEQRAEAIEAERAARPNVDDLNSRLEALGPPPAEGAEEPPEIAARRAEIHKQIADAQVPALEAQEASRRAEALIADIDRVIRARFSAELMSRGSSPLRPSVWSTSLTELGARFAQYAGRFADEFADPVRGALLMRQLPFKVGLIVAGLIVAFWLRAWLIDWVERRLDPTTEARPPAWVVALRNATRIVVPAVGAGLLFAAFGPDRLLTQPEEQRFFSLPDFVIMLIAAGWLADSLLAPRHKPFRLVPLDDREARAGARVIVGLGIVLALAMIIAAAVQEWDLSTTSQAALFFPLVLVAAFGLWRAARLIDVARKRMAPPADAGSVPMRDRFLQVLVRVLRAVAVVGPVLALAGYMPAAGFMVFRSAATLGLMGATIIVFDLLNRTAQTFLRSPTASAEDGGLIPVVVGALVGTTVLPFLAMTWGARPSDIADTWMLLREGVNFGGIQLSAGVVMTLAAVFALGAALTRLLQTVLRGTVLPRTRLDPGGRNAVLAGTGYVGFTLAALAAVSAAGLDLSNIAIVAGALSVGIGFGLQNVVSNFVSGIILLIERPVKEGDWIEVGGFSGYVRNISVRSTEIQTFDRASVIVPNSDLIAGTVLNRTHAGMSGRLQVPVSVTYGSDPKAVEAILLGIAETHPLVLDDPAPRVLFLNLGPDSMDFELRCWLRDVNFSLSVRSDMNFDIVQRFREKGLRVQYYGRDLPPEAPPEPPAVTLHRAKKES